MTSANPRCAASRYWTHVRPVDEATLHHVPAEEPLHGAEDEDDGEPPCQARRNPTPREDVQKRHQKDDGDQSAPEAVDVLQPKDALEAGKCHVGVERREFGILPVLREGRLPVRLAEGRQPPAQRPPLHHGQPRMGEAGDPSDDHHGDDHGRDREQPCRDRAPGARVCSIRPRVQIHAHTDVPWYTPYRIE